MIKVGDIVTLDIEKLIFGSEALARFGEDNFVVFIKDVLPNEKVKAKITSLNKKFARAELIEIINKSPHRIKPLCPIYNACGSCNMQICDYDYLIQQKTLILKDIFKDIIDESKIYDVIKSPAILNYRHKIQYPARQTKNSKRILLGYFKNNSHDITNIKFCPLQPQIINEITQFIRNHFPYDCYCEKNDKGLLKNVLFRINQKEDGILLTFVLNKKKKDCSKNDFKEFFNFLTAKYSIIKGCFLNFNPKKTNAILGDKTVKILGKDYITENLADKKYKIGSTSFFQVNPKAAEKLFDIVKENVKQNSKILDAYGGVGAIGIYLKEKASEIVLVEENSNAVDMAKKNFELNEIKNYEILEGDAKKHFENFKNENKKFDYVILDPPRSGCDSVGLEMISKSAQNIIYVSCNPQTLKRDMKLLIKYGFKPKFVQGVDLFPYTHHIESVVLFER